MTEIKNQITQTQETREIQREAPVDWRAPIEHFFIGSTPPPIKGKYIDVIDLLEKIQKGDRESLRILLTPMSLQEETRRLKKVREEREIVREEKGNRGIMTIFDIEWQLNLGENNMSLQIEPSPIDDKGRIKGVWRILILDNNNKTVENPTLIRGISLKKNKEQWFSLEVVKKKPYKLLKLNLGK